MRHGEILTEHLRQHSWNMSDTESEVVVAVVGEDATR